MLDLVVKKTITKAIILAVTAHHKEGKENHDVKTETFYAVKLQRKKTG